MNKQKLNQQSYTSRQRSVVKALSWRLLASIDTFIIAFILTGKFEIGLFMVGTECFTKMFLYYLHERGWAHIKWGHTTTTPREEPASPYVAACFRIDHAANSNDIAEDRQKII